MTSEVFAQILKDLDIYASSHNIKRPLILFMDRASPHISLSRAKFSRKQSTERVDFPGQMMKKFLWPS